MNGIRGAFASQIMTLVVNSKSTPTFQDICYSGRIQTFQEMAINFKKNREIAGSVTPLVIVSLLTNLKDCKLDEILILFGKSSLLESAIIQNCLLQLVKSDIGRCLALNHYLESRHTVTEEFFNNLVIILANAGNTKALFALIHQYTSTYGFTVYHQTIVNVLMCIQKAPKYGSMVTSWAWKAVRDRKISYETLVTLVRSSEACGDMNTIFDVHYFVKSNPNAMTGKSTRKLALIIVKAIATDPNSDIQAKLNVLGNFIFLENAGDLSIAFISAYATDKARMCKDFTKLLLFFVKIGSLSSDFASKALNTTMTSNNSISDDTIDQLLTLMKQELQSRHISPNADVLGYQIAYDELESLLAKD